MKFFEIVAKCGHVGRDKYYAGHFFVKAKNAKNAAKIVKRKPRVKRDHEDAILSVMEVSYKEYVAGIEQMKNDPYFNCKSKYEQKEVWEIIKINVYKETDKQVAYRKLYNKEYKEKNNYTSIYINGHRMRNPYKYCKMNNYNGKEYVGA